MLTHPCNIYHIPPQDSEAIMQGGERKTVSVFTLRRMEQNSLFWTCQEHLSYKCMCGAMHDIKPVNILERRGKTHGYPALLRSY